jgi:hypothetical protein
LVFDATPSFYIEPLKRLRAIQIQPYFMLADIAQLETVERLIRNGHYMGPLNHCIVAIGGGAVGPDPSTSWTTCAARRRAASCSSRRSCAACRR